MALFRKLVLLASSCALLGCPAGQTLTTTTPRKATPDAAAPKRVKLAVLPVESDQFPRVAAGLNGLLHEVQVPGVDDYVLSKVTLEVVQLSIECVEPTRACYTAVGKSLLAQRLLLAHVAAGGAARAKKRPVKVSLTLFDVDGGGALTTAERSYKDEQEATDGLPSLVKQALGAPGEMGATK